MLRTKRFEDSMKTKSVAIVTGASQGIGRATALRLSRDFSAVVLAARNKESLESAAVEVRSKGSEAMVLAVDLREPRAAEAVVSETLERFGRIDALLNIAGAVPQIDLFEMTDEQWNAGMELKLHGARRLTIRAWDALKRARLCSLYVRKCRTRSEACLRGCCGDQRCDHSPCE